MYKKSTLDAIITNGQKLLVMKKFWNLQILFKHYMKMYSAKNVCHGFQNREQKVLWVNVIVKNLNINNMEDFEITKEGIVIIQWLNNLDPRFGEDLYTNIKN